MSERLVPISTMLGVDLPSREVSDALVDIYFYTVHWFSLILYEPTFRKRYTTIMDLGRAHPTDRAFLLLLLMVMVMGCWYGPGLLSLETASTVDLPGLRHTFLKVVTQSFMDLIDEDSLEFVQLSALLGSYWLYWGRPRSAFSILGAATKSAQANRVTSRFGQAFVDSRRRRAKACVVDHLHLGQVRAVKSMIKSLLTCNQVCYNHLRAPTWHK